MLALRYDLLPVAYCDELFGLLNQVAPFSYDEVRAIIRQELGGEPEVGVRDVRAAVVRGGVDRPGPPGDPAQRRPGRGQGPAAAHPRDPAGRHPPDVLRDLAARLDPACSAATKSREVIDEFARWTADEVDYLVEARQAVLLREHAPRRPVRADRARVPRLHDLARPDGRADRGHPADRGDGRQARRGPGVPRPAAGRRATTSTGSSATSTGTCSTRCSCSATSTPTCTRPTSSCSKATRSATSTSGSWASSPTAIRESLTRYSWLLFRGEIEPAVRELMRWLAPGPSTDIDDRHAAADPPPPGVPVRRDRPTGPA